MRRRQRQEGDRAPVRDLVTHRLRHPGQGDRLRCPREHERRALQDGGGQVRHRQRPHRVQRSPPPWLAGDDARTSERRHGDREQRGECARQAPGAAGEQRLAEGEGEVAAHRAAQQLPAAGGAPPHEPGERRRRRRPAEARDERRREEPQGDVAEHDADRERQQRQVARRLRAAPPARADRDVRAGERRHPQARRRVVPHFPQGEEPAGGGRQAGERDERRRRGSQGARAVAQVEGDPGGHIQRPEERGDGDERQRRRAIEHPGRDLRRSHDQRSQRQPVPALPHQDAYRRQLDQRDEQHDGSPSGAKGRRRQQGAEDAQRGERS